MTTRSDEINKVMHTCFSEEGFEDTPDNRLAFYEGLQAAWNEDPESTLEKTQWMLALATLIATTRIKIAFPGTTEDL